MVTFGSEAVQRKNSGREETGAVCHNWMNHVDYGNAIKKKCKKKKKSMLLLLVMSMGRNVLC